MGREQRVAVDSLSSDWLPVLLGVPQGSILGLMLFLCYINDMPSCTQNSTTALFADDSKCFRPIHSINDCLLLQKDINGYGKRAIGFNAPEKVSRSLFTVLVRSDVEYCSSLWSGTSKHNLQLIEGIQGRATNCILH